MGAYVRRIPTPCATAVARKDITPTTVRKRNRQVVHFVKRMAMWRKRARERRTIKKGVMVGRHPSFIVVMQWLLSLHTVILIIVCTRNNRRCKVGKRVRYLQL